MNWLINLMLFGPALAGLACLLPGVTKQGARNIALGTTIVAFAISLLVAIGYAGHDFQGVQYVTAVNWIDVINVEFRTGIDGLNLPLVLLTTGLSILVVLASFSIEKNVQGFMCLYMLLLTGMLGVFLALDLFLFYVFFEISLLPMYFLIGVWGGPRKEYAAIKFFLFTLVGSICLLIVMLGLYFFTPDATGGSATWVLAANEGETALNGAGVRALFSEGGNYWFFGKVAFWLTLVAFMVKLPAVPFHTWLPDAHVEAPTPISMVLAGVLLKMGGYAMMRVTYPIFPDAARYFWAAVATLGVIAILYGALCAMAQTDWKKLVAYSSVSHMGYVLLGLAVLTPAGFNGAYFQMIAHGVSSALMFFLVGVVYERAHRRDMNSFGGLWLRWPGYGAWSLVGFFAGMGLPGLCGFIGEVSVLLGTFQAAGNPGFDTGTVFVLGALAAFGVVLTAGYILWMFQRIYMGKDRTEYNDYNPVSGREYAIMGILGVLALVLGLLPVIIFDMTTPTIDGLLTIINAGGRSVAAALGH